MTATRLICDHCHELIGVYEPIVVVSDGEARETSRAAEPAIASEPGKCYHRDCYFERAEQIIGRA